MSTSIGTLTGLIIPRVPAWRRRAAAGAERRTAPAPPAAPPPAHEERLLAHLSRDIGVPAATLKAQRDRDALFHIIWSGLAARRLGRDRSAPEGG